MTGPGADVTQVGGTDQRGNMVSGYELISGTTEEEVDVFGESRHEAVSSG